MHFECYGALVTKIFGRLHAGALTQYIPSDVKAVRIMLWIAVAALGASALGVLALSRGEEPSVLWFVVAAICVYSLGYRFYSRFIADRGDDEPQHAGFLAARKCEDAERGCAETGDDDPEHDANDLHVRRDVLRKRPDMQASLVQQIPSLPVLHSTQSAIGNARVLVLWISATLR